MWHPLGQWRAARPVGLAVVAFALTLTGPTAGCVSSSTQVCSWGLVCPADMICDEVHEQCVYAKQIERCEGVADFIECSFPGADPGEFMCLDGVCLPKPVCGNSRVDEYESCDGTDLGGRACADLGEGFTGGTLGCDDRCELVTTLCFTCGDGRCEREETLDGCPEDCRAVSLTAGNEHTCVALADGTARCWGTAEDGELGHHASDSAPLPTAVYGLTSAVQIAAGGFSTCALLEGGTARCWGDNTDGALGDGITEHYDCGGYDCTAVPSPVANLADGAHLAAGSWHHCALLADGTAMCWGYNGAGALGDGTRLSRFVPVAVHGLTSAVAITAGVAHTCALLSDATVSCWGGNDFGQLGTDTGFESLVPLALSGVSDVVQLEAGGGHTCALREGGVGCWGYNQYGQLGDGTTDSGHQLVTVTGLSDAVAVTAGQRHTCALLGDGTVRCWGANGTGQLGDGTNDRSLVPVTVQGLDEVTAVAAGGGHTCALRSDFSLWCWGNNSWGQLGNGSFTNSTVPVQVLGWSGARYGDE